MIKSKIFYQFYLKKKKNNNKKVKKHTTKIKKKIIKKRKNIRKKVPIKYFKSLIKPMKINILKKKLINQSLRS